jgi:hypothetical protein
MKKLTIAAFIAAQLTSGAPASAADLVDTSAPDGTRMGSFAGARVRISLDGAPRERVRAGLTIAPTARSIRTDGASRLRIGEGLEYGVTDRRGATVSISGRPVSELAQGPLGPDGQRRNVSTLGWVAIGAGVVLVVAIGAFGWLIHEANENSD